MSESARQGVSLYFLALHIADARCQVEYYLWGSRYFSDFFRPPT
ncbi:hypothetical protein [Gilliamella sp. wkB7]|nr:hypothetical protein [Gilliamella apicola]